MNRRIATDADLTVGSVVFKSAKSSTAWKVTSIATTAGERTYSLGKATSANPSKSGAAHVARFLYIEA